MPVIALLITVLAVGVMLLLQRSLNRSYDYECETCGYVFGLSMWQGALAPHSMGRKWVRCPNCGNMTWTTHVPKQP